MPGQDSWGSERRPGYEQAGIGGRSRSGTKTIRNFAWSTFFAGP
jgi:hypothetical protein